MLGAFLHSTSKGEGNLYFGWMRLRIKGDNPYAGMRNSTSDILRQVLGILRSYAFVFVKKKNNNKLKLK